jgi:hypothetical protein
LRTLKSSLILTSHSTDLDSHLTVPSLISELRPLDFKPQINLRAIKSTSEKSRSKYFETLAMSAAKD